MKTRSEEKVVARTRTYLAEKSLASKLEDCSFVQKRLDEKIKQRMEIESKGYWKFVPETRSTILIQQGKNEDIVIKTHIEHFNLNRQMISAPRRPH